MRQRLEDLGERAIEAVKSGAKILVLDDQSLVSEEGFAMPMLLALSHIHQLLIREELRMETSLLRNQVKQEKYIM